MVYSRNRFLQWFLASKALLLIFSTFCRVTCPIAMFGMAFCGWFLLYG